MSEPVLRRFDAVPSEHPLRFADREVFLTPGVQASEGGPLSTYSAHFGRGERADLPAPYEEVWVVFHGRLRLRSADAEFTVGPGQYLHVPENTRGQVEALSDSTLVCVSVPAH